ncbi:MAG: hypothetical protein H6823_26115 [Planctomycetaceae bacterium]|nr:hypothetical protein [Planctomycetales bacterium]MCB9941727.1 hypothetical protein [Planctomycetaceae bacterium]
MLTTQYQLCLINTKVINNRDAATVALSILGAFQHEYGGQVERNRLLV